MARTIWLCLATGSLFLEALGVVAFIQTWRAGRFKLDWKKVWEDMKKDELS